NQVTIAGVDIMAPGEFEYTFTRDGDGRVPHTLGRLAGVDTWYVGEVHGDLARNERVPLALDDLLQNGSASNLAPPPILRQVPSAEGVPLAAAAEEEAAPTLRYYRAAPERAGLDALEPLAEQVRAAGDDDALSESERQTAADALIHAALGARPPPLV